MDIIKSLSLSFTPLARPINKRKQTFSHHTSQVIIIIMPKNSLTKWDIAKTIAPSVVTMVILPIVDVSSDITVVCNLYMHAHWHFATILLGQYKIVKPWYKSKPMSKQNPKLNKSPPKKEKRRIWTKG